MAEAVEVECLLMEARVGCVEKLAVLESWMTGPPTDLSLMALALPCPVSALQDQACT